MGQVEERRLLHLLLVVVALCAMYAISVITFFHDVTTTEVANLLQTVSVCCGVIGWLVVVLRWVRR